MERQNVTLSIPRDVLVKAKHLAIDRETSLSGLLTDTLKELVEQEDEFKQAHVRQQDQLEAGFDLGLKGQIKWSREDLHERR